MSGQYCVTGLPSFPEGKGVRLSVKYSYSCQLITVSRSRDQPIKPETIRLN